MRIKNIHIVVHVCAHEGRLARLWARVVALVCPVLEVVAVDDSRAVESNLVPRLVRLAELALVPCVHAFGVEGPGDITFGGTRVS